jgi:phosphinothricin acetyltransferase
MIIRKMNADDRRQLFNIYLQGVEEGNATFETDVDERKWWRQMKEADVFVIEEQTVVVGWVKMMLVSARPVYQGVRELSLYVDRAERGKGYGRLLLQHVIHFAEGSGIWTLQSHIFPENKASLTIQQQAGFRIVGRREKIAQHAGRWRETLLLERRSRKMD